MHMTAGGRRGWTTPGSSPRSLFVTLLAAAGTRATPGVLIVRLQREFGWNRAEISLAVSINLVLFGTIGPFAAALMARFGLRRVVLAALTTIATGVANRWFVARRPARPA